jgi:transcriptional/translational regulatory protein YebC/TACO1
VTIEAVFPSGVAAIIECQTESKGRTLMEVRTILSKHSGNQSPVQFLFKRRGVIVLKQPLPEGVSVDAIMEHALEVEGFEDIEEDEGMVELISEPNATKAVADAVVNTLGVELESLEIVWQPVDLVDAPEDDAALIEAAVEKIGDLIEVQEVYLNMRRGD